MSTWSELRGRAAGKWQIPLLALSVVLLTGSLFSLRPNPVDLPIDRAVAYLDTLVVGGLYDRAIKIGEALLGQVEHTRLQKAPVRLQLARGRFLSARERGTGGERAGRRIIDDYREAASQGQRLNPVDFEQMGRALEWQRRFAEAVVHFDKAVERGAPNPLELRKHAIELREDRLGLPAEQLSELLDSFLHDVGDHRLDLRLWAIDEKIEVLNSLGRSEEASTLLGRNESRFRESDLRDRFAYLQGLVLYRNGFFDEAETHLRTVRNRVAPTADVQAMTGWLLGRVIMNDGGPQRPLEALSFFADVLKYHAEGPYAVASRIGMAEALALLERHEEAVDAYRLAIESLDSLPDDRLVSRDVLRVSLGVTAGTRWRENDLEAARQYALLASQLIDRADAEQATLVLLQLARIQTKLADQIQAKAAGSDPLDNPARQASVSAARLQYGEAAATYLEIARLNAVNDRRAADASWEAAGLYAKSGQRGRAAALFQAFTVERPQHPLVPRAFLRMGQLRQAGGELALAVSAYQQCYRRFPRTLDGTRALIPLAQCYLAMDPTNLELAEKTLRIVLEQSDVFTPEAPEFADAQFLLGEALSREEAFEQAIATLEEALQRYPDDPRVTWARFLLADAFRQSALALKRDLDDATFAGEVEQIRNESAQRLTRAGLLFRELLNELETRGSAHRRPLDKTLLRHARVYEADCYFETGNYAEALKLYEEAAGLFKNGTAALSAYVQIVNCHVFLGEREEARAALARALVLADSLPAEVFEQTVSPETRQDWKRYFEWLGESELF